MDKQELARILKDMYDNPIGSRATTKGTAWKKTMVHMFGIKYAREIEACGDSATEIARSAGISDGYRTEINNGRRLAEYVEVRGGSVSKWRT